MRRTIGFALLALAACNKAPEVKVKNATVEEVAAQVKANGGPQVKLQAGEWQIDTGMKLVEAKGIPEAAAAQMRTAMERTNTAKQCLTKEDVEKPNVFAGKDNSRCKYDNFEMGGGKVKALMHCPGQAGSEMVMTMDGSYGPTEYAVNAAMDMRMPGSGQSMKMTMRTTGKRLGECPAGSAAK